MLRDFSLRDFGASLNTVESYTNESSQGKIGLYEAVNKQKCTHLGMFLASAIWTQKAYFEDGRIARGNGVYLIDVTSIGAHKPEEFLINGEKNNFKIY